MAKRFRKPPMPRTGFARSGSSPRIGGSQFDPFFQIGNRGSGELALRGHFDGIARVADGFDQQAFVRFAGLDDGSRVASLADAVATIEQQTAPQFLGIFRMSLVAVLHEDWTDFFLEEVDAGIFSL